MADKGIIFSAPMVRALLDGRKTQTRRLLKPAPEWHERSDNLAAGWSWRGFHAWPNDEEFGSAVSKSGRLPYAHGDRLYVREAFSYDTLDVDRDGTLPPWYWADGNIADAEQGSGNFTKPKPSIHMPRWASRLTLLVTDVRVQRVAEISEADILAEGAPLCPHHVDGTIDGSNPHMCVINEGEPWATQSPRLWFHRLWNSLHDKPGERWEDSPWVVAVSFDVKHGNIDRIGS